MWHLIPGTRSIHPFAWIKHDESGSLERINIPARPPTSCSLFSEHMKNTSSEAVSPRLRLKRRRSVPLHRTGGIRRNSVLR